MKKFLSLTLILFLHYNSCPAQSVETCLHAKVETVEECEKAETCINKLCDFTLEYSLFPDKQEVIAARYLILKWMNITMNYGFTLSEHLIPLFKGENSLLIDVYMTCLAKGAFISREHQDYEGLSLFVKYIKDPKNQVSQTKDIKKFVKDWEKGNAKKYVIRGTIPS